MQKNSFNTYLVEDLFFRLGLPSVILLDNSSSFRIDARADSIELTY